jgi:hypothetical protein
LNLNLGKPSGWCYTFVMQGAFDLLLADFIPLLIPINPNG